MTRHPTSPLGASRCAVFVGAVLLLVLLAGLDMPKPPVAGGLATAPVQSVERAASPRCRAATAPPARVGGDLVAAGRLPVRAMARTRSVAERGLPCPRAPTA